jgi:hypothetical protein|nr:MAG: hypothetical protein DIU61_13110 [Bacteroidota bacterium]
MKRSVYILIMPLLFSCGGFKDLAGEYVKKEKDYKYSLTINQDSTFSLVTQSIYARSGCKGKWKLSGDTLLLHCADEPFPAQIASGYMNEREKKVIILNEKRLQLDQVVLKKLK